MLKAAKAAPIHSGIGTNAGAEFFAGAAANTI